MFTSFYSMTIVYFSISYGKRVFQVSAFPQLKEEGKAAQASLVVHPVRIAIPIRSIVSALTASVIILVIHGL